MVGLVFVARQSLAVAQQQGAILLFWLGRDQQ